MQLDPISAVARSPLLVLHARLGAGFAEATLDRAIHDDRACFEYWAHDASIVPVADLPLHRWQQRRHLTLPTVPRARVREWMTANARFAEALVADLREHGPLRAQELEDHSAEPWRWGYWSDEVSSRQTVARMLQVLWLSGRVGVAGRRGIERLWDVFERCVPPDALGAADAAPLTDREVTERAVRRALSMLGVAKAPHIARHFTRGRYPGLAAVLADLTAAGELMAVAVEGCKGTWYATAETIAGAAALAPGRRTVALSPFDNVLCDRARTAELFGFDHRLEIYTPPAKRRWGYYVLPILHGERFVARADLKLDRRARVLSVLALHEEPGRRAPRAVAGAIERLAAWRGATVA
ncbi:MAG: winged helix DNA-binding domain-containing protein [Actinomycetota bacterium]|nr:winged helix DNA-binding domain-containing protein [Actinomycetota bacterium]